MKYEEMLKEKLINICYEKDRLINELRERLEKLQENEEINRDALLENARLKQELKDAIYQRDMNCHTINNLKQYKQEKVDFIKWLESKNQFHYKNGKIEDNYILVSEVLNKVRGD